MKKTAAVHGIDARNGYEDSPGHENLIADAVIFDMDGLLLDSESLARRSILLAGKELGLGLTEDFCALLIGVPADGNRRLLLEHYGDDAPADLLFETAAGHLQTLINKGALQLKPGVIELLDQLDRVGLPRAVATSSGRQKALHHLRKAGIAEGFAAIVTRDDVARGKPWPDLFLGAARAIEMPPERCLALEDSYNGVRAAHAAGMPVIMVPDLLPPTDEMRGICFSIVPSLHEVSAMLLALGNETDFPAAANQHGLAAQPGCQANRSVP